VDPAELEILWRLGVALGIGAMIGLERGFALRGEGEGKRVAGLRTFGLIGLAGGLAAVLGAAGESWLPPVALLALAAFLALGAHHEMLADKDVGITTLVAALLTFLLGIAAGHGLKAVAAAGAVVVALVLSAKRPLHGLLERLDRDEVLAALKLLVMSLVVLPLLPNQGYGPYGALNPYQLWWMVVLVAGLSSAGYFAIKFLGAKRGLMATALLGGLVSSTAVTVALAQRAKEQPSLAGISAAAALAASAVVPLRLAVVFLVVARGLLPELAWPLGGLLLALLLAAGLLWRRDGGKAGGPAMTLGDPFEIGPALKLGLLLAVIFVLTEALPRWLGEGGLYLLAAIAGLADVDAISLSYASQAGSGAIAHAAAAWGILIAVAVNNLVKAGIGLALGGRAFGLRVAIGLIAANLAGALALLLAPSL